MPSLRTVIADDHEEFRKILRRILEEKTECVVVGEALNGPQAVQQTETLQPDVVVLDLALPQLNGIEVAKRIRRLSLVCKIIFLSQDHSLEIVQGALRIGALGYLLKSDANQLPEAVNAAMKGTVFVSSRLKT